MQKPLSPRRIGMAIVTLLVVVPAAFAQTGVFNGVVYDDRGQPLRGATIRAENPSSYPNTLTTTSDPRGRTTLVGLRSGQWSFTVEHPGYQPSVFSMPIRAGIQNSRPVTVRLERDVNVVLGGPLAGVDVRLVRIDLSAADEALARGDLDAAISGYRTALSRAPALSVVHLSLSRAYRQKQDLAGAAGELEALLQVDPANATGLYQLAEIRRSEGQIDTARDLYQRAAAAEPTWAKPLVRLGAIAIERSQTQAAISHLKMAITADPGSSETAEARTLLQGLSR